jgi:insulysin
LLNSAREFGNDQLLSALPQLTVEGVGSYYPQFLKRIYIEILVHGNFYKEDILRLADLEKSTLLPRALPQAEWPISRSLVFSLGDDFVYRRGLKDPKNANHCVEYFLYIGDRANRQLRAKALLFDQMTQEAAFDQLRTKENLGYIVFNNV